MTRIPRDDRRHGMLEAGMGHGAEVGAALGTSAGITSGNPVSGLGAAPGSRGGGDE